MTPVNYIKLSVTIPKPAKQHAEKQARTIAKPRGEKPNVSRYITDLILRDRAAAAKKDESWV